MKGQVARLVAEVYFEAKPLQWRPQESGGANHGKQEEELKEGTTPLCTDTLGFMSVSERDG